MKIFGSVIAPASERENLYKYICISKNIAPPPEQRTKAATAPALPPSLLRHCTLRC